MTVPSPLAAAASVPPAEPHGPRRAEVRAVYFEETCTADSSGDPVRTPRYECDKLLHRLDLTDPRLGAAG